MGPSGLPCEIERPFRIAGESEGTPRDWADRLLSDDGELVYEYLDASTTFTGALLLESRALLEEGNSFNLFELLAPARRLLGPDLPATHVFSGGQELSFRGLDLSESPLLDGLHLVEYLGETPTFPLLISMAEELLTSHEAPLAELVFGATELANWSEEPTYDSLSQVESGAFADELMAVLVEMAEAPGLLEGLLEVADSEEVTPLGFYFGKFMAHRDVLTLNPADPNAPPSFHYSELVDRDQADIEGNQSIFQRFLHLIHDTKGARLCNREGAFMEFAGMRYPLWGPGYGECELFEIEDMSVFYLKSILGEAEMGFKDPVVEFLSGIDIMLETMSGITGFTKRPTFQAMNRFVFGDRNEFLNNLIDPPLSADGVSLELRHPGTIFAWEETSFIEALRPVLMEFHKSSRDDLFIDLVSAMHLHWASKNNDVTQRRVPEAPGFSNQSGLVYWEDLMSRGLLELKLVNALSGVISAAKGISVDGVGGAAVLTDAVRQWTLPSWNRSLTGRRGERSTLRYDGATLVTELAAVWLLLELYRKVDEVFEEGEGTEAGLGEILAKLRSQFLQVEPPGDAYRFSNRRGYGIAVKSVGYINERFQSALAESGHGWTYGVSSRGEQVLGHPFSASAVRLVEAASKDPGIRLELEQLFSYLLDAPVSNETFSTTVSSLVDGVQRMVWSEADVPLLRALAPALKPGTGFVPRAVAFGGKVHRYDRFGVSSRVLGRLLEVQPITEERPLEVFIDVFGDVNRVDPGSSSAWTQEDTGEIFRTFSEFLLDESRGLERMYQLMEQR